MLRPLTLCAAAMLPAVSALPQGTGSGTVLVKAPRIQIAPDLVLEDEALLVRDGSIALVGPEIPDDAKRGVRILELDGTVTAGLVNPHTHLGLGVDLAERITAVTPDLRAADAFDPFDELLLQHAHYGVTTVGLAPLSANTFAGLAATVKVGEIGEVMSADAYLKVAMVDESLDQGRYPTSRMGTAELIRASFADARMSLDPNDAVGEGLRAVQSGATRLAIHARSHGAITRALDLCDELGVEPLLIGGGEAEESIARLATAGATVMLEALQPDDKRSVLELPGKLEAAGIPFSFMADRATAADGDDEGQSPRPGHPESLRMSAALAIRHGASRAAALASITQVPARQCGLDKRCGALRQGMDADFVVWSGDPTDLTSRLEAVYIGGIAVDLEESN